MRGSVGRYALLVAAGEYQDETLNQLRAPQQDIERLAAVLEDPDVGGFTSVTAMCDATDYEVRMAIENLLTDRDRDDLVLLYFSCHGMVDVHHRLYFATTNTQHNRPGGSAVSRSFVNEQLEMSAARAKRGALARSAKSLRSVWRVWSTMKRWSTAPLRVTASSIVIWPAP